MPEAAAALTGAMLLFILPVDWRQRRFTMSWAEAVRIVYWGTIFLFGGGLALGPWRSRRAWPRASARP